MRKINVCLVGVVWTSVASVTVAEEVRVLENSTTERDPTLSYTTYGTPGLIDMPTAQSAPDAELAFTATYLYSDAQRYTLTFQMLPRLSGSFRYIRLGNWRGRDRETTYDRSFDLRYRFNDEGKYMPAFAIGLQDFVGTGWQAGEYLVATKHITPRLTFTGGIGWGRFGTNNSVENPLRVFGDRFETRRLRPQREARGGTFNVKRWFRGDMGFFGGVAWSPVDRLVLKAEYSSDGYVNEVERNHLDRKSSVNFALDYEVARGVNLQGYYLYGDKIGGQLTFTMNPKDSPPGGYRAPAPAPVKPRDPAQINNMSWVENPERLAELKARLAKVLKTDGMTLEAVDFDARIVTIRVRNERYIVEAEMIGRTARIMTQLMPDSVSTFRIVPVSSGIPAAAITLNRGDLETLENAPNGAAEIYARAQISDFPIGSSYESLNHDVYPKFNWSLGPDINFGYFDPDKPFRYEVAAKADVEYNITPGLYLNASVNQPLFGTLGNSKRRANSRLPHVRTDASKYNRTDTPRLGQLTAAYYFRPGKNLYGRVTGGLLEQMFGGVSGELMWASVDKPYAFGAEMNYAWQRGYKQRFKFRDYKVATGHVSGYFQLPYGFDARVDLGRYLAKDWGGTLTLDRTFVNGWKVGAYATITDVTGDKFGEGSFDKGIRLSIPLTQLLGKPTQRTYNTTIKPITRDGGAKLSVPGSLHNRIRKYHRESLKDGQGRFWR